MHDLTLGEKGLAWIQGLLDRVRSRPVALFSALVMLGAIASAVPTLYEQSTFPGLSFNIRVIGASGAIGVPLQLGLVVAAILLLVDRLGAGSAPRLLCAALAVAGAAGVIANLASLVIAVNTEASGFTFVGGLAGSEARTFLVLDYLAPAVLAGFTCWVAVSARRAASPRQGAVA